MVKRDSKEEMPLDIMKMAAGAVTPMLAAKVAGAVGVPEGVVRKVMAVGVPVILASLLKRGSTAGGVESISATLGSLGNNPLDGLGKAAGGDASRISAAAQSGSDMLGSLIGSGTSSALAKTLAAYAGIDEKAAGPMLGLASTTALGGLKTAADEQGLTPAGVMRLLGSQKDQLDAAIPPDLGRMLSSAGIVPQSANVGSAPRAATPAAPVAAPSGDRLKWVAGIAAVAVVAWLGSQFFGSKPDPVITAATEASAAVNALVVDGVNIGESVQGVVTTLTSTLGSVTDAASADAAVKPLTDAETTLVGLEAAIGNLSGEGRTALATLVGGTLPTLKTSADALLADSAIGPILKPVLNSIVGRLASYAG
jgi:hypothetical protein